MTTLTALIGAARLASCDVVSLDRWIVCTCTDARHSDSDRRQREVWADGHRTYDLAWHRDRDAAVRDGMYMGGAWHIVLSPAIRVTGPEEVQP